MNRTRAGALLAVAVLGAQAGHLLAYQVRFAGAAEQLQSAGAHTYFPALAKTVAGLGAAALLAALLVVGVARVAGRRRIAPAPSLLRVLAALFTLQLAIFVAQEVLEARLAGLAAGPGFELVLWGTIGQLPAAAVGAVAVRWLVTQVEPAAVDVKAAVVAGVRTVAAEPMLVLSATPAYAVVVTAGSRHSPLRRRGPPPSPLLQV